MKPLTGKIAVVTGATRGAGRGIACMLGEAGATVYCTGRSSRSQPKPAGEGSPFELVYRPETIEETAEMVTQFGGVGIPVQADHTIEEQVIKLFSQIETEQGRMDILVNDIWGGDELAEWDKSFWEQSTEKGFQMIQRGLYTHLLTNRHGVPLMVKQGSGLIIEVTDGDTFDYRGSFFYDLVKTSIIRIARTMSEELSPKGITALAVTPGFLRSEAMLEHFGVTEENWQDGAQKEPHFIASETPYFVGRAIAALAADPNVSKKSGGVFSSWGLSGEYEFVDIDGRSPHWGNYFKETFGN